MDVGKKRTVSRYRPILWLIAALWSVALFWPSYAQAQDRHEVHPEDPGTATVNVAHFAPFADSVDATAVTVRVDGMDAFHDFKFGDIQKDIPLPAGEHLIQIVLPNGTVAIEDTVNLMKDETYLVAAIGDVVNQDLELFVKENPDMPVDGKGLVRAGHLAPFANTIEGTKVNICTDDGTPVLENVAYKDVADLMLPPGDYDLKVVPVANACGDAALDLPAIRLAANEFVDLYVIGDIANLPLQPASVTGFMTVPEDPGMATVNVAHFAPCADTVDATAVTVRVDGMDVFHDFKFGDIQKDIPLPAGEHLIQIVLPDGTVTIEEIVNLTKDMTYLVAAIGDGTKQPLELFVKENPDMPVDGKGLVRAGHLAPFADTLEGTKVNICTDDGTPVLENVAYKDVADLMLPPGDYDLKVVPVANACGDAALDLPAIRLAANEFVDLYVIGDIVNLPLQPASVTGFMTVPEDPGEATVNVAHFAPFADSVDATAVTVRVDGMDVLHDFKFGDIQKDIPLPAGEHHIQIVLPNGTVAIEDTVNLMKDETYLVAAIGDVVNQDLELFVKENPDMPVDGKGLVRAGHLAPFANTIEGTKVNICTDDGTPVLENVAYKDVADLMLPPGDYDLKVVPVANACGDAALDLPAIRLAANEFVDLYVIGDIVNLPLQPASVTGFMTVPEDPGEATVNVAHFAPFADSVDATAVTVRVDGMDVLHDFKFGDIQKDIPLPAGEHHIQIVLPNGTVAIEDTVNLMKDETYLVAAIGDVVNQDLELFVNENPDMPVDGKGLVRAGHLAPFADTLEGTKVNICTDDGTPVLENVAYKDVADLMLPPGDYDLKVVPVANACGDAALDLPAIRLAANEFVDLYVIGDIVNLPIQPASVTGFMVAPETAVEAPVSEEPVEVPVPEEPVENPVSEEPAEAPVTEEPVETSTPSQSDDSRLTNVVDDEPISILLPIVQR